jgi:hypothetical protein
MGHIRQPHSERTDWLRKGPLGPGIDANARHLTGASYSGRTVDGVLRIVTAPAGVNA